MCIFRRCTVSTGAGTPVYVDHIDAHVFQHGHFGVEGRPDNVVGLLPQAVGVVGANRQILVHAVNEEVVAVDDQFYSRWLFTMETLSAWAMAEMAKKHRISVWTVFFITTYYRLIIVFNVYFLVPDACFFSFCFSKLQANGSNVNPQISREEKSHPYQIFHQTFFDYYKIVFLPF